METKDIRTADGRTIPVLDKENAPDQQPTGFTEPSYRTLEFVNAGFLAFEGYQNTFRVGQKWADLRIGERLVLAHRQGEQSTPIGTATVEGVHVTDYKTALRAHAVNNHEVAYGSPALVAASYLDSILQPIYHPGPTDRTVVIYLRRD